jgi:hypothetical protein
MTAIDNPFDGEAARLQGQENITEQQARDCVVLRYLKVGDTRALAHWLEAAYCPGEPVRRLLSFMLQPVREDVGDPDKTYAFSLEVVPFELKAKRRDGKRGAPRNPVSDERNQTIYDYYVRRMAEVGAGGYESVITDLVTLLGPDIKESAIREAIKARSPKSGL